MNIDTRIKESAPNIGAGEFSNRIDIAMKKSAESNRPFFILTLQIQNMKEFRNKRPNEVVNGFQRELYNAVRMAVHPSQYVGVYQDGLGLLFDAVDPGKADTIAKRLLSITLHVIRTGRYNDLTSRWTDILQQFLWPNNYGIISPRVGWAIFPRDGSTAMSLMNRAKVHVAELAR